jgi:hypothetical protein
VVTSDDVRRVLAPLPRSYEVEVRGRWKFRVGQIVYVAFSRDEQAMGFGFAKTEREGLIASDPGTFFLPPASDLRFPWVCAHLGPLEAGEMRELVVDAWRMCTPKMLHELPELPTQAMAAWSLIEDKSWSEVKPLLHPNMHFTDRTWSITGRAQLLAVLAERPTPRPPTSVEIRDGQIFRWRR